MARNEAVASLIGKGTYLKGTLNVTGSLRIDGKIEGDITVEDTIIIGKDGEVKGTIKTRMGVIGGIFNGNIESQDKLELQKGAKIEGEITCRRLIIEEGVIFNGNCKMPQEPSKKPSNLKKEPNQTS